MSLPKKSNPYARTDERQALNTNVPGTERRKLAATLICVSSFTAYTSVFPVFGPRITELFSLSAEEFGSLMGMQSLGRILALLMVGPLISWYGVRRISELGFVGFGVGFLLLGVSSSIIMFQSGLTLLGLFIGVSSVAHPAFLFALYPTSKRRIFSIRLVAVAAPTVLLPLVAGAMLHWSEGGGDETFRLVLGVPFLIVGGALVGGGLLMTLQRNPGQESTESQEQELDQQQLAPGRTRLIRLLNTRSILVIVLICLHASADNTVYIFLPMFMKNHFHDLPIEPALAVAGHGLAYLFIRSLLSVLPEGVAQRAILCLSGPIGGLIVMVSIWSGSALYVPVLYTMACFCFAAEFPTLVSELSSRSMTSLGTVLASAYLIAEVAKFGMLKITGRVADQTGDYRVALSFAAAGFIAFGIIAFFTGLGRPENAEHEQSKE
ncbi:MAG: MFS transporter [Fuerstiella sp.]|nr:MFS transporter [Fuerstiella sp.]